MGSNATGKVRVVVDVPELKYNRQTGRNYEGYRRQSYPQRKDGTHNYAEIAKHIRNYAEKQNATCKADSIRRHNEPVAMATRESLKVGSYNHFDISASQSAEKPLFVKWSISRAMTADEACALYGALKCLGLVTEGK